MSQSDWRRETFFQQWGQRVLNRIQLQRQSYKIYLVLQKGQTSLEFIEGAI